MSKENESSPFVETSQLPGDVDSWARQLNITAKELERRIAERHQEGKYPTKKQREDRIGLAAQFQMLADPGYVFEIDDVYAFGQVITRYNLEQFMAETHEVIDSQFTSKPTDLG